MRSLAFALTLACAPALLATVDRDHNHMSDVWAAAYPAAASLECDADADGVSNQLEALAGTDPLNPHSRFYPTFTPDGSGNYTLRWPGSRHKRYVIENSTAYEKSWRDGDETIPGVDAEIPMSWTRKMTPTPRATSTAIARADGPGSASGRAGASSLGGDTPPIRQSRGRVEQAAGPTG